MRGQVLNAGSGSTDGLILGDDGKRYTFASAEWKAVEGPTAGTAVDFLAAEAIARDVFPLGAIGLAAPPVAAIYPNNSNVLGGIGIGCLCLGLFFPLLVPLIGLTLGLLGAGTAKQFGDTSGLALSRIAWIGNLLLLVAQIIGALLLMALFGGLVLAALHNLQTQHGVSA
jgi:hypothetical protein